MKQRTDLNKAEHRTLWEGDWNVSMSPHATATEENCLADHNRIAELEQQLETIKELATKGLAHVQRVGGEHKS